MSFVAPLKDLFNQVQASLAAEGDTTRHLFGGAHVAKQDAPPLYIWVPTRFIPDDSIRTRGGINYRELTVLKQNCVIHCRGSSYDVAEAMWQNLFRAVRSIQSGDVRIESGALLRSESGASFIQNGEVIELTISIRVAVQDRLIPLDTLDTQDAPTVVITGTESTIYAQDTDSDPGEPLP